MLTKQKIQSRYLISVRGIRSAKFATGASASSSSSSLAVPDSSSSCPAVVVLAAAPRVGAGGFSSFTLGI